MSSSSANPIQLRGFIGQDRLGIIPTLLQAIDRSGAWVLQRSAVSPNATALDLEFQAQSLPELYANLLAQGLEFTRDTHLKLSECCNVNRMLGREGLFRIVSARLAIHFVPAATSLATMERVSLPKAASA